MSQFHKISIAKRGRREANETPSGLLGPREPNSPNRQTKYPK